MSVTYDAFMQMDHQNRIRSFNEITPENRATLVRTQIERWLAAHRASLTAEQVATMEDNLAFAVPDNYRLPKDPRTLSLAKELEAKTAALFTREQIMEALTIQGPFIPAHPH